MFTTEQQSTALHLDFDTLPGHPQPCTWTSTLCLAIYSLANGVSMNGTEAGCKVHNHVLTICSAVRTESIQKDTK